MDIRKFVATTIREFLNEQYEQQNARNHVTRSYEKFVLNEEEAEREEAILRMGESMDKIEAIWGEETMDKLKTLAKRIKKEIVLNGGNKIGRTCEEKAKRLSNYNSDENPEHNFKDLAIVETGGKDLIAELESFFIDYFKVVDGSKLLNSDGEKRGREECKDSDEHKLYVTIPPASAQ